LRIEGVKRGLARWSRALITGGPLPPTNEQLTTFRSPHGYAPKHLADKILQWTSALEGERCRVTALFPSKERGTENAPSGHAVLQWCGNLDLTKQ
jgi:hypothetical protein